MANRREISTLIVVSALTVILASVGLMLAFGPRQRTQPNINYPAAPEQGPALYEMQSVRSGSNRIRLTWREIPGATAYRVTVLTASDDSLFSSPHLENNAWVIPEIHRSMLKPQTVYHWRLTVIESQGQEVSDTAAFTTR